MINKKTNNRKYKRYPNNKNNNGKLYGTSKKVNKFARDKLAIDPFDRLNEFGITGKISNKLSNKVVEPIIVAASYSSAGRYYNPKKDNPSIGSFLYTFFYFVYKIVLFAIVSLIISLLF